MKMFFICNSVNKQSRGNVMPKSTVRFRFIIGLSAALILLFLGAVPYLQAATFTVTNTNDNVPWSLRHAIINANGSAGADVINFDGGVTGTITLATSLPTITDNLVITGPGEATLSVSGNDAVLPFIIAADVVVTISGLTVEKGDGYKGGGILNYGVLTLTNSTVCNNEARGGGGIFNYGKLTLENVTVSNNTAQYGGGIYNYERNTTAMLINSHVDYNSAEYGGGIESGGTQLTLTNSTVNYNTATEAGGGIKGYSIQLTLTNSTVNYNTANDTHQGQAGGGMEVSGTVTLFDSHVDHNSAPFTGGIKFKAGTLTMDDSSTVSNNVGDVGIYHFNNGSGEMILNGGTVSNHERAGIWNELYEIMTVNNSTVSGNGVGIRNQQHATTMMTLNRVTVSGNGTGIENHGTLSLNNSTVSDNTGHGIVDHTQQSIDRLMLYLNSSTVSGNGGNGITSFVRTTAAGGRAELINTIVANNGANDCAFPETITSFGHNLDSDGTCNLNVALNDLKSTDPKLGPLQDNGGPTWTQALFAGSPAIDAGICNDALYPTDQRGISRPQNLYCDIGAYEYVSGDGCDPDTDVPVVSGTTASPNPVEVDTQVTLTALVEDLCSNIQYAQYNVDRGEWSSEYYPSGTSNSETISMNMSSGTEPGVFTVCVQGTDDAGNISNEECIYLPVYDPSAGFVTGGGWIDSPEGAYVADPSATGKANFGFVAKYKKGATVPDGNTEFQFKAADLNFHSSEYEWLVVTGSDYAKFKGSGTINGEGSYKFQIWAGDGDTDTFRIKIWEEDEDENETVTYDNGFNQAIGGGSIVIHDK